MMRWIKLTGGQGANECAKMPRSWGGIKSHDMYIYVYTHIYTYVCVCVCVYVYISNKGKFRSNHMSP